MYGLFLVMDNVSCNGFISSERDDVPYESL